MDADLETVCLQITQAHQPEDLFGSEDVVLPEETLLGFLEKKYSGFKSVTSPAIYHDPEDVEAARDADEKLERLYAQAQQRIREFIYGIDGRGRTKPVHATKSFTVGPNRYYIGEKLVEGEHTTLYEGFLERGSSIVGEVAIKVARDVSHNPWVQNEVRNLDVLRGKSVPQWKHLPFIIDRFQAGGRVGLVQRKISGFTLAQVREHRSHRDGVDRKHVAWMLDRTFSCLGYVHDMGMVHGALCPNHIVVQPRHHNLIFCGWGAGILKPAETGEKVLAVPTQFTAPEVRANGQVGPWSDFYSVGKVMIWALGGDPDTNSIPAAVEEPMCRFILSLVHENPLARPRDAWDLYEEQCRLKDSLWPRKFIHFDMS